ncbi:hypothetical protein LP085_18655, partial [Achromobacter sp. MY14]|uniref:hypothetical protein n=1 Tax=unclassified Achromobacter TaxID=2626865 RepID=UPI001E5DA629
RMEIAQTLRCKPLYGQPGLRQTIEPTWHGAAPVGWVQRGTVMPRTHNADRAEPILQWLLCGKAAEE